MIVCFLVHPVAFLLAFGVAGGSMWAVDFPEDSWYPIAIFAVTYLIAFRLLPWWTQPILLYRHLTAKRRERRNAQANAEYPRPAWMNHDEP